MKTFKYQIAVFVLQFKVHSIILGITAPGLAWHGSPPPLSCLREDILETVLHYLYTECLPKGLSEETARDCIKVVGKLPGLDNFTQICQNFIKNTALKQRKLHFCYLLSLRYI